VDAVASLSRGEARVDPLRYNFLPFLIYTGEELYLWAFRQMAPPLVRQFAPDVLVTQLGMDTHYRDPLAMLMLTTHGYVTLIEELKTLADGIRRAVRSRPIARRRRSDAAGRVGGQGNSRVC